MLGKTGCGKSTLVANMLLKDSRFLIFDVKDEYLPEWFDGCVMVSNLHEFIGHLNNGTKRIIFRAANNTFTDPLVNYACFQLIEFMRINKGLRVTLAMDELNRFVTPHSCPAGLRELIQRGRSHGVEKIFGAQWFSTIPTWTRDSFSEVYAFRHTEPRGLALLESYGLNSAVVQNLPPHTALHYDKEGELTVVKLQAYGQRKQNTQED